MATQVRASIALPSLFVVLLVLAAPAAGGGVDLRKSAPAAGRGIEMSSVPNPPGGTLDPRSDEYQVDDGVGERSIGIGYGTLVWLNHFQVLPFNGYVSEIAVAWGDVPAGLPAQLLIFDDPNNDGSPQDVTSADLLLSLPVTTEGGNTDTFYRYPCGANVGNAGDHFYVGVCCAQADWEDLPARFDETAPAGQSWAAISGDPRFDCANPNSADYPLDLVENYGASGNWMVRAGCEVLPGMTGACCLPNGGCMYTQAVICGDFGHGRWYPCGTCADCPHAEACCLQDGTCQMLAEFGCDREGGHSLGPGSTCVPDPCPTSGLTGPAPGADALLAVSPNPFRESTRVWFQVAVAGRVVIEVLDCSGRVVRVLQDGWEEAGPGSVGWDGRDSGGSTVASGVYFVRCGPGNTRALVCIR